MNTWKIGIWLAFYPLGVVWTDVTEVICLPRYLFNSLFVYLVEFSISTSYRKIFDSFRLVISRFFNTGNSLIGFLLHHTPPVNTLLRVEHRLVEN